MNRNVLGGSEKPATILFDVSDLLQYLLHHTTPSGIQRVQCEILRNLVDIAHPQPVRFVALHKQGLGAIDTAALLDIVENVRSGCAARTEIEKALHALRLVRCKLQPRDIFLTIGAFWNLKGMGALLQNLKNSKVIIGVFIHDLLPIVAPEYFEAQDASIFANGVMEALTFADFVLTTSEYNKASLAAQITYWKLDPIPVHLMTLGRELSLSAPTDVSISSDVADIINTDYVLCVGTIEVRKNPAYLFNLWKMMVKSGRSNIPTLVFAGRKGWLVQDFLDQLKACNYLGGKILVAHNVTDVELDLLYRKCILTMFPSFVEGWGLPVGESLAYGKICLCSATGGTPEAGGELADYIDPYNVGNGLEYLLRYLDDPELRRHREREISARFVPRSWRKAADDFLRSTQALARQVQPIDSIAAIRLPPGHYLPISSQTTAVSIDGIERPLSPSLICVSGWHPPEISGARAAQTVSMIRFRVDAPVGTRINLVMRLTAHGSDFRLRIRAGSGAETEVSLSPGSEKMAVLPCDVEAANLVTAHLSTVGTKLDEDHSSGASHWLLKGILYFDPKRMAGITPASSSSGRDVLSSAAGQSPTPAVQEIGPRPDYRVLRSATMDESRRAPSFGAFLQTSDSYWPTRFTSDRDAPIFVDQADAHAFFSGCGNPAQGPQVGSVDDSIKLVRRSDQFVSMSRFSEGSVFDRSGVWRAFGYFQVSPPAMAPWLSNVPEGLRIAEESLASAPYYHGSYLVFYNGNLHNYYHWMVEGLLSLDILSRALGVNVNLKIALPKSMEINAVFDHREALRAVGLDRHQVIEVASNLIRVQEAIWVESDLIQTMPAPYVKDFQQRIAGLYRGLRGPRNRRLLVARKGPTRTIHNIEQVQGMLSRHDFETVYLEGMSTLDQILLFQSAEFIISPHGAGLANLLFCAPGTKVIELTPAVEMRPFFWLISEKLDLVHGMQFCSSASDQGFQAPITIDTDKLQALIRMLDAHL